MDYAEWNHNAEDFGSVWNLLWKEFFLNAPYSWMQHTDDVPAAADQPYKQ